MVTHRKALLSLMDKIYVMDGGKLHGVGEYGGLDAYLRKISDTEVDEKQRHQEAVRQQQELAAVARLEAEKDALQAKLAEQESATVENGTVYINH
jgi:ABC-type protease/lipase transport system fused ATPase/permease subunit